MVKGPISLKIRQGMILLFLLLVALPILYVSITRAYYASLVNAAENTLEAHLYSLVAEVELTETGIAMPSTILAPELNRLNSDTFAYIFENAELVWASESAASTTITPKLAKGQAGTPVFQRVTLEDEHYWQLSLSFLLENAQSAIEAHLVLVKDDAALQDVMKGFKRTLTNWIVITGLSITALMILGFIWSARPLRKLDKEIKAVESGAVGQITGDYPVELKKIQADLNLLLQTQQRQKERYRASLSDLAHALKTPLAVLKSSPLAKEPDSLEQLDRIAHMIEHQLKRAASGGTDTWKKHTDIQPVVERIFNAMSKVYHDKHLSLTLEGDMDARFMGDKTDLMELLGNILDNACKACQNKVKVTLAQKRHLSIVIEDDGPGIPSEARSTLLERGKRLDTYSEGHGVGMAIVTDLVSSYQGKLTIGDSQLGGALFLLEFSHNAK